MSATNFYQTFYQTEQLFRLADEPWGAVDTGTEVSLPEPLVLPEPVLVETAGGSDTRFRPDTDHPAAKLPVVIPPVRLPVVAVTQPAPVVVVAAPEPLPPSAPRPTAPALLPPIQQPSRLPELNHKVLLLADEVLDPGNLLFLEKILKAVNLNVNGVDLLNLQGTQDVDFNELLKGKYIHHFITFGVPFERIHLDIMMDRYAPVRFDGITFLMADSLPTIEADQNLKKQLWNALQRVFLQRYT